MSKGQGVHAGVNGPRVVFGEENLDYQGGVASASKLDPSQATASSASSDWGDSNAAQAQEIAENLDDYLEIDSSSISVNEDGSIDTYSDDYPPEQGSYGDIDEYIDGLKSSGWEPVEGVSNQFSYNGAIMHPSEFLSGSGAAKSIVSTPGTYAAVSVWDYVDDDEEDEDGFLDMEPIGWMVLRKP